MPSASLTFLCGYRVSIHWLTGVAACLISIWGLGTRQMGWMPFLIRAPVQLRYPQIQAFILCQLGKIIRHRSTERAEVYWIPMAVQEMLPEPRNGAALLRTPPTSLLQYHENFDHC